MKAGVNPYNLTPEQDAYQQQLRDTLMCAVEECTPSENALAVLFWRIERFGKADATDDLLYDVNEAPPIYKLLARNILRDADNWLALANSLGGLA